MTARSEAEPHGRRPNRRIHFIYFHHTGPPREPEHACLETFSGALRPWCSSFARLNPFHANCRCFDCVGVTPRGYCKYPIQSVRRRRAGQAQKKGREPTFTLPPLPYHHLRCSHPPAARLPSIRVTGLWRLLPAALLQTHIASGNLTANTQQRGTETERTQNGHESALNNPRNTGKTTHKTPGKNEKIPRNTWKKKHELPGKQDISYALTHESLQLVQPTHNKKLTTKMNCGLARPSPPHKGTTGPEPNACKRKTRNNSSCMYDSYPYTTTTGDLTHHDCLTPANQHTAPEHHRVTHVRVAFRRKTSPKSYIPIQRGG